MTARTRLETSARTQGPASKAAASWWPACLVTAATLSGCVPDFKDFTSLLTASRVLAVRALPAEAGPGDKVQLNALVAPPASTLREWFVCSRRKPLNELGPVAEACIADPVARGELGVGETALLRLPEGACRSFGPIRPEPEPGEPAGRPVDPDATGGFFQPVIVDLEGSLTLGAVRLSCGVAGLRPNDLVEFNRSYRPNENPAIESVALVRGGDRILLSGKDQSTPVAPGERIELEVSWVRCPTEASCGDDVCGGGEDRANCGNDCATPRGCSGAEPYVWVNPGTGSVEPRREAITLSWFATSGSFAAPRTGRVEDEEGASTSNSWTAPDWPGTTTLWFVIRDSRGGVGWADVTLTTGR